MSKKILIIELHTEERAVGTIISALKKSDWKIEVLGKQGFFKKLNALVNKSEYGGLIYEDIAEFKNVDFESYNLILIMNPKIWSDEMVNTFLKVTKSKKFGIGVFEDNLYFSEPYSNLNIPSAKSNLFKGCSFVYISDIDFVNKDNLLVRKINIYNKNPLVIPFRFPNLIMKTIVSNSFDVIISGNVQFKRRSYIKALFAIYIFSLNLNFHVNVILNGKCVGLYGWLVSIFCQILNMISRKINIVYYRDRVSEEEYSNNLKLSQVNLLPLRAKYYDSGKDSGAYYDSLVFNLINVVPEFYSAAVGSYLRLVDVEFKSYLGLIKMLQHVHKNKNELLQSCYELQMTYINEDLNGYLENEFNKICAGR